VRMKGRSTWNVLGPGGKKLKPAQLPAGPQRSRTFNLSKGYRKSLKKKATGRKNLVGVIKGDWMGEIQKVD